MLPPVKILMIFPLLLTLFGCAELAKHTGDLKPTAQVTGVRIANINFDQADMIFELAVDNRNPVAVDLAGLDYDFRVENQSLISGHSTQEVKLQANAVSPVQLPVTLKFADLKKLPGEIWQKDNVAYELNTTLNVILPVIGKYAMPLSKQGKLPVPRVPGIQLKDVSLKNLSLSAAEVVAQVEVSNPNSFTLAMRDFDYQLNINRQHWGGGSIAQTKTIPGQGRETIDIPFKLDLMSMGTTMFGMLNSREPLQYRLTGNATLDTDVELLKNYRLPIDISGKAAIQ